MLDTEDARYRPHSLRYSVRDPVHQQHGKAAFSTLSTNFWQKLKMLRAIIDQGDASIGQPAYNGGLFASSHAILDEIELSDAELAPIIHQLSHTSAGTYLSYRNLEVQQLGSVYERLLERIPRRDDDNQVDVTISPYARKDSGSYYTPQELVDLIVEQTLTPLVEERIEAFRAEPIEANDPAEAILKLTILDPAMGSGHFLITAIDWLTVRLAALVNREWDEAPGYVSPCARVSGSCRSSTPPSPTTRCSSAWCSSAASTASTRIRWPSSWPRSRSGCTRSPASCRCRTSITASSPATRCSAFAARIRAAISPSGAATRSATRSIATAPRLPWPRARPTKYST